MNQKDKVQVWSGGLISIILLIFYVFAIGTAIRSKVRTVEGCRENIACMQKNQPKSEGVELILNVVGGLVSALVIAELAITQRGEWPSAHILKRDMPASAKKTATAISLAFIIVWLLCGIAAVAIYVLYSNAVPSALSEFAKSWLGLAIASAYSYLGVR